MWRVWWGRPTARLFSTALKVGLTAGLCTVGFGAAAAQMIYTHYPKPGETFVNGCLTLPLHAAPTALSKQIGMAELGGRFEVIGLAGEYVVPESMRLSDSDPIYATGKQTSHEATAQTGREKNVAYAWIEVRHKGEAAFASSRCLIGPGLYEQQTFEDANRKFKSARMGSTGKGFNVRPVLGRGGKEIGGNMAHADADAESLRRLIQRHATSDPHEAFAGFRMRGGLGEFNARAAPEWILTNPAADKHELRELLK
ncbi:hypothetical protein [Ferruginivarius sediminum]|uniref:Uncharacterized protein n=1 Tax=Ferruginivarius sediminum TaxID=2661937 RepID=A0A369TEE4_9PROT|nr:hypothetical protein [Ferruginivarius sediminum]RDD63673.1 hypothetical protein DRB17_00360 [Ferruginivarius sediminum]